MKDIFQALQILRITKIFELQKRLLLHPLIKSTKISPFWRLQEFLPLMRHLCKILFILVYDGSRSSLRHVILNIAS